MKLLTTLFLVALFGSHPVITADPQTGAADAISVTVNLTPLFNNKGVSSASGGGNFDGQGGSYPLSQLPQPSILSYRGVNFSLPNWNSSSFDNVLAQGQVINITAGRFLSLHLLGAGDGGGVDIYTNNISVSYTDGTDLTQPILVPAWKYNRGIINSEFTFTHTGVDNNASHIHHFQIPLNAGKTLQSIILPSGIAGSSRFHVFSLSLFTASSLQNSPSLRGPAQSGPTLVFQYIRSRNQWYNDSALPTSSLESTALSFMKPLEDPAKGTIVQVIEVGINNLPQDFSVDSWLTGEHTVEITSPHLKTIYAGRLNRLRGGDQARVKVGVVNVNGVARGSTTQASAIVRDETGKIVARSSSFEVVAGIPEYSSSMESLAQHEAPKWFEDSKFGIFVHWGVYSVPAFAPSGVQYAEWYWYQQHNPNNTDSPTWVHHKETYGEEFLYDDFIPMFNPISANWSADTFTDLFAESGAKYFILVTKHHDGIALFDTGKTTNRSTVALGPKHDFIHDIMQSASAKHPELVQGTYFSLPEWFNPAWAKYGVIKWQGGLAHNAYNWSEIEPYTGYIEVEDFIQDIQKPQIEILMDQYGTSVMWCDGVGQSNITEIVPGWYNRKYQEGKNVALEDRCGTWAFDFSTPEYQTYGAVKQDKWESNSGLDPFSYGYNAQTPDANYMNKTTAIQLLVDIVSKNGNWLLDIGPTGNGSVVQPEINTLRGIGAWLQKTGKSIYATDYWFITPQESSNIRFTTTPLAFYITNIDNPSPSFTIESPIPILPHDKITLLGGSGKVLKFSIDNRTGVVTINVSASEAALVSDAWVFEVVY